MGFFFYSLLFFLHVCFWVCFSKLALETYKTSLGFCLWDLTKLSTSALMLQNAAENVIVVNVLQQETAIVKTIKNEYKIIFEQKDALAQES